MRTVMIEPEFEAWRRAARAALRDGYRPDEIDLQDASAMQSLSLSLAVESKPTGVAIPRPHTTQSFLADAPIVGAHRSPARWNLLYRILYRLQENRNLLKIETDADVSEMRRLRAQVWRDLHKMHAFVRFRKMTKPGEVLFTERRPEVVEEKANWVTGAAEEPHLMLATVTPFGINTSKLEECDQSKTSDDCEHFVAWYQPDNRILTLAAPFFAERFAILQWTILTPDASVSWDPATKVLNYGAGVPRQSAPEEDELETLWKSYYKSIYNPARLNVKAMKSEMPVRYWKNLPEISTLPELMTQSTERVASMISHQQEKASAASFVPAVHTLQTINSALPTCKGCELYCHATQAVPGTGSANARILVVGEQPGDQEDLQGLPFVGPAGKLLDRILEELGIDRAEMYVTNAVKHFKFVQRGKLRLHQSPRMSEITACRPWLLAEIDALKPKVVLCLGASAAKSIFGGTFALMKDRGKVLPTPYAEKVIATLHPSALLRARDEEARREMMEMFKADVTKAVRLGRDSA